MPTTEFSFQELCSLLGRQVRPEEVRDSISMLGVDVERIDNEKIIMEVFPNRPDMLGIEGFARALKGVMDIDSGLTEYQTEDSGIKLYVESSVKDVRPYISAGVVRGVSLTDGHLISLMNIQEKLHITHGRNRKKVAIGVHDLSKVTPPFVYKAAGPEEISFVPLDTTIRMNLSEILKKHPKGMAYASTLKGFGKYPVIVDKNGEVLSFPPIINGERTRLSESTQDVFIDVTGTDRKAVDQAMNILVSGLLDRCGTACTVEVLEGGC
jgi:phenylalanyl-tRNA synthetase beta chain